MATALGRQGLTYPDLGDPAGATQVNQQQTVITRLSDSITSYYEEFTSVGTSVTFSVVHNLGTDFDQLEVKILLGTHATGLSAIAPRDESPPWFIEPNGANPTTTVDITTPFVGGAFTGAILVNQRASSLNPVARIHSAPENVPFIAHHGMEAGFKDVSFEIYKLGTASTIGSGPTLVDFTGWVFADSGTGPAISITPPVGAGTSDYLVYFSFGTKTRLRFNAATGLGNPPTNMVDVFLDSADERLKRIDSSGDVEVLGGGGLTPTLVTGSFTAEDGNLYIFDSNTPGSVTVTMPDATAGKYTAGFKDDGYDWNANNVTVAIPAGNTLTGFADGEDLILDETDEIIVLAGFSSGDIRIADGPVPESLDLNTLTVTQATVTDSLETEDLTVNNSLETEDLTVNNAITYSTALRTQMGLDVYQHSGDFTLAAGSGTTVSTVNYAWARPFETNIGWFMEFGFSVDITSATAANITISGIDTNVYSGDRQAFVSETDVGTVSYQSYTHVAGGGSGINVLRITTSSAIGRWNAQGTIRLNAKPTWAN